MDRPSILREFEGSGRFTRLYGMRVIAIFQNSEQSLLFIQIEVVCYGVVGNIQSFGYAAVWDA